MKLKKKNNPLVIIGLSKWRCEFVANHFLLFFPQSQFSATNIDSIVCHFYSETFFSVEKLNVNSFVAASPTKFD